MTAAAKVAADCDAGAAEPERRPAFKVLVRRALTQAREGLG
jgi:hypothetical protein